MTMRPSENGRKSLYTLSGRFDVWLDGHCVSSSATRAFCMKAVTDRIQCGNLQFQTTLYLIALRQLNRRVSQHHVPCQLTLP